MLFIVFYPLVSGTQLNKQQLTIAKDLYNNLLIQLGPHVLIDSRFLFL